jgi:hypothetical protein
MLLNRAVVSFFAIISLFYYFFAVSFAKIINNKHKPSIFVSFFLQLAHLWRLLGKSQSHSFQHILGY